MTFGEKIRAERKKHHVTQAEIATKLHVSRKTISSWETGRSYPDIGTLIRLSDIYKLSLDRLLREDITMINHYEKQAEISKHDAIICRICYYLNIILLFATLINRFKPFPAGNDIAMIWVINLIILCNLVDWHQLLRSKATRFSLIITGLFVIVAAWFLILPNLPNFNAQSWFTWGTLSGELVACGGYTASFLLVLFDRSLIGIR